MCEIGLDLFEKPIQAKSSMILLFIVTKGLLVLLGVGIKISIPSDSNKMNAMKIALFDRKSNNFQQSINYIIYIYF